MKPNRLNRFSLLCSLICYLIVCCPPTLTAQQQPREVVRILAVGNSFSDDGVEYLDELAKAAGIRLIVGNLYIGGCSLERHWENVSKGLPAYDYRKNCEGVQSNTPKTSLLSALQDEPWDYITVQQVSQNSGLYDTYYPFMPSLLQYLRTHATNPGVRFAIHQVWAYACDSNHSGCELRQQPIPNVSGNRQNGQPGLPQRAHSDRDTVRHGDPDRAQPDGRSDDPGRIPPRLRTGPLHRSLHLV